MVPATSNFTPKNIQPSTTRSQLSLLNKATGEQAAREAVVPTQLVPNLPHPNNQGNVYIFNIQFTQSPPLC